MIHPKYNLRNLDQIATPPYHRIGCCLHDSVEADLCWQGTEVTQVSLGLLYLCHFLTI